MNRSKRTRIPLAATALLTTVLLAACSEEPAGSGAPQQPPAASQEFRIPPDGFAPDLRLGQRLFIGHCAECHGVSAQGTEQGPPLIHRIYEPSHHADIAFYRAIALGVHQHHWEFGDMAPVPGVDGDEAAHIIDWIRQEQRKAGIE